MSDTNRPTPSNEPESAEPIRDLDPQEVSAKDAAEVKGGEVVATNLANMRHEMLKSVAQNLRA